MVDVMHTKTMLRGIRADLLRSYQTSIENKRVCNGNPGGRHWEALIRESEAWSGMKL